MRSIIFSLTQSIDKVSEIDRKISQIDKKEPDNTFTDSMRSMIDSLSKSINKISEIDDYISQINNKFTGNMRSMISSLSPPINEILEIFFFFYLGFLLRTFTNHRTAGEGGGHFFNSSLPLPPASQTIGH